LASAVVANSLRNVVEHARVRRPGSSARATDRRLVHVDDLVELLDPAIVLCLPCGGLALVDPLHQHRQEDVADERALAAPADAGDGHEAAERNLHVDVAQVVLAGALIVRTPPTASDASSGQGSSAPGEVLPVIESLTLRIPFTGPL
jgi:hypothetical protein